MANYLLPPLKVEKLFEELTCDLFNFIENTSSCVKIDFETFGVIGQNQKGIDIFYTKTKTVIQCKLKNNRRKDETIRKYLIQDINIDLENLRELAIDFDKFVFSSTCRDDALLQEYLNKIKREKELPFHLYYWGWDTITKLFEQSETLFHKYFPKLVKKSKPLKPKIELLDRIW